MSTIPLISQLKSAWQFVTGDAEGAKETWHQFTEAWSHPGQQIADMANSIPLIGHIKGIVHLIRGEKDEFWQAEEAATRTLVVLGAGALTVSTGGAAAPILAGVVAGLAYDGAVTGIESLRHEKFQPQGYIATGAETAKDWRGGLFDIVALGVGDGWLGSDGKLGRTTKVYRVEGESYARTGKWEGNRRLFPDGDGVVATSPTGKTTYPTVKYYPRGNKLDGKVVVLGLGDKASLKGNMLFLNFGERARADAFYAQRVLQYRDAVDNMIVRGERPIHEHHQMRVKSFRIMTRATKDLQQRAITEAEKAEGLKPYDGVLRVDITKSRGQYGCDRRIYTPLLRDAIKGSYEEFTPWIEHLPSPLLSLIADHQVAYGHVRVVFVRLANSTLPTLLNSLLLPDLSKRLQDGSKNDTSNLTGITLPLSQFNEHAIQQIEARDVPVVGLRQSRHAKCGRQVQTDVNHGQHFEYLAEFPDGTSHWYPSPLVADDLKEEFEALSIKGASEVAEVISASGTDLTVRRRNKSVDTVHQNQLFWLEEPENPGDLMPLHDEEIEALINHGHNDEHLDICVPATLSFQTDWVRVDVTTPGTTFRKDNVFDDKIYENVTFTNTSIMFSRPHSENFQHGVVPFVIVNHGPPVDLKVTHGRDRNQLGDKSGCASVSFGGTTYRNERSTEANNETVFHNCPLFLRPANSYAISVRLRQPSSLQTFTAVERVGWHFGGGATWICTDEVYTLLMPNSGTSGALLLQSLTGERVFVVVGINNGKSWCDIVTGISPDDWAGKVIAMYYDNGGKEYMRWKNLTDYSVRSARGTNFRVRYLITDGHNLDAEVIIG
ncbi:Fungal fruit body lectin domain containing protein [Amanita muscaria]